MKKQLLKYASFLLTIALLIGILPAAALAANTESVVTGISFTVDSTSYTAAYSGTADSAEVTLPYANSGNIIDLLASSLNLSYDPAEYFVQIQSSSDYTAKVGDVTDTARIDIIYHHLSGSDTADHPASYTITLNNVARQDPTFTGAISAAVTSSFPTDHSQDYPGLGAQILAKYTKNDGNDIGWVKVDGTALHGHLQMSSHTVNVTDGSLVPKSSLSASDLTYEPTSPGTDSFRLYAFESSDTSQTSPIGAVDLTITVSGIAKPTISGVVAKSITAGSTYTFTLSDFSSHYNLNSGTLDTITITPTNSSYGTWSKNASAFSGATSFTKQEIDSGYLKFKGGTAAGTATFGWTVSNEAGVSASSGTGSVTVSASTTTIPYTTAANKNLVFNANDFNTACTSATGSSLNYVYFTLPSSSYGALYYSTNSSSSYNAAVSSSTALYKSSIPYLSYVTFIPASGYTGTFTITYTGYSITGIAYTGYVKITVGSSNTVTYTTAANTNLTFNANDFNTACSSATGSSLNYVYFTLPSSSYGALYYSTNSSSSYNAAVSSSTALYKSSIPYLSYVTFIPASGYTGTFTITYTGYSITGIAYTGYVKITVGSSNTVTYTTAANTNLTFNANDFNTACSSATGSSLNYVYFTLPSSSYGALYYSTNSSSSYNAAVSSSTALYKSSIPYLSYVTFIPASGYTGTFTITYTGYSTAGIAYTGYVKITVGNSNTVTYTTAANTNLTFNANDFNTACSSATGSCLNYVYFNTLPSSSYGALYYSTNSSSSYNAAVSSSTLLYKSSIPYLSYVTFIPASGYTGTFTITYTGYSTAGTAYTGYVKITVGNSNTVTYTTAANTNLTFNANDFNTACYSATGNYLNYVKFTLPSSSYGALYYSTNSSSSYNAAVSSSTLLYKSSIPYLSYVTFIPASGYTGTFTITYTGYSTAGTAYTGYVKITVGNSNTVTYTTAANTNLTFNANDFNTACYSATGKYLNYVKFTLPSSSYGALYYSTNSSSSYNAAVSSSTLLYKSSIPYLSYVTFIPASGYTGTFTITYTGVNTDNISYTGYVKITVTGSVKNISYSTVEARPITFSASDFSTVCSDSTGNDLSYVKFTLPPSSYGTLYYNYSTASSYDSAVSAGSSYYKNSAPYLSYVSFVPAPGYTGTVTMTYTGYSTNNASYTGKITVTVSEADGSSFFSDVGASYDWAADAIDALYQEGIVKGTSTDEYSPAANISRGDFILMLHRALNFSGIPGSMFSDVPADSYYYSAIAAAKAVGIAQGSSGTFRPDDPLTRQDAMVLIYRALEKTGHSLSDGKSSDLAGYSDTNKISGYALTAVATLVKDNIIQGSNNQINPRGNMTRAEMAVVLYRIV